MSGRNQAPHLSLWLSGTGDRVGALAAIEEAVGLNRGLVEAHPAAFTVHLATSLASLSERLSETGDRVGALAAAEEAVGLDRGLAGVEPAAFTPDLANSTALLADLLVAAHGQDEALAAWEDSGRVVLIAVLRSRITADAAGWCAEHDNPARAPELIATACQEAESDPPAEARVPESAVADAREHVRERALQLAEELPEVADVLPAWVAEPAGGAS